MSLLAFIVLLIVWGAILFTYKFGEAVGHARATMHYIRQETTP